MVIFLDMDGVICNIHKKIGFNTKHDDTPKEIYEKGFYLDLEENNGARDFIYWAFMYDEIDLWIATKTPSGSMFAASEVILD